MWNLTIKQDKKKETRKQTQKIKTLPFIDPAWHINHSFTQKCPKINYLYLLCYSVTVVLKCFICSEICRNVKWRLSINFRRDVMCTWQLNAEFRSDLTSLRSCMMQTYLQYCEQYHLDTLKETKHAWSICSHILITWLINHMISQLSWLWLSVKLIKTLLFSALIKNGPWSTHNAFGSVLSSVQRA